MSDEKTVLEKREERRDIADHVGEEAAIDCTHIGYHNPPASSVMLVGEMLMNVSTHNCKNCGHVFTKITELATGKAPAAPKTSLVMPTARPLVQ